MVSRVGRVSLLLPLGLVGLALWLVSGLALTKYHCEFVNLNCIFAVSERAPVKCGSADLQIL